MRDVTEKKNKRERVIILVCLACRTWYIELGCTKWLHGVGSVRYRRQVVSCCRPKTDEKSDCICRACLGRGFGALSGVNGSGGRCLC